MQKRTRNILTPEFQALFLKLLTNGSIRRLGMYSVNDCVHTRVRHGNMLHYN